LSPGIPTKLISATMALAAFTIAVVAGLAVDNPAESILAKALISMLLCHFVGFALGALAERTVTEGIESYIASRQAHPQASVQAADEHTH